MGAFVCERERESMLGVVVGAGVGGGGVDGLLVLVYGTSAHKYEMTGSTGIV